MSDHEILDSSKQKNQIDKPASVDSEEALVKCIAPKQVYDEIPVDPIKGGGPRSVFKAGLSFVDLDPAPQAKLLAYSQELALEFGLQADDINALLPQLSGSKSIGHLKAYATCYGGHQFGQWAGQLGDGRAYALGSFIAQPMLDAQQRQINGVAHQNSPLWEWQLKGAGITPYSRRGDGKAVLRSSVREFLCSEAMAALGVPTTRALSLVSTGEKVWRDMFYDGHTKREPGAIVCRLAPSFIRFGHFELPSSRGDYELTRHWLKYVIRHHYWPAWQMESNSHSESNSYSSESDSFELTEEFIFRWFTELSERTAHLVCEWMRVGFVHGVMNTDNMSALGLTIDYGPYGWIDDFDLDWTPNTSDAAQRRYRFGHQADIARWNLSRLAYALAPLVSNIDDYIDHLEAWPDHFRKRFTQMLCTKLGTLAGTEEGIKVSEAERVLIKEALPIWQNAELDMTIFFRTLNRLTPKDSLQTWQSEIRHSLYQDQGRLSAVAREEGRQALWEWLANLRTHLSLTQARQDPERRQAIMNQANPAYVLRNYLAQEAIEALEAGNEDPLHQLHHILKTPYTEQKGGEVYQQLRPEWARHKPGCSRLSCSS